MAWLAMAVLVSWAGCSLAADAVPDLTGTWKGTTQSVGVGQRPLTPVNPATKPTFVALKLNLQIQRQKGRVFYGIKFNKRAREPIAGVLGTDNTVYLADTDGYDTGTLFAPNKLELAYVEAGRRTRIAAYTIYKRVR